MKLTEPQIQNLYTFTRQHFVEYYDLQTELVDHLANGIEEYLEENPRATFESALNSEFKKFGIMGFNDVIEEKTKALNKYYRKRVWRYFKGFFKLPKIILTLFLIWSYYTLLINIVDRFWLLLLTFIILFFLPMVFFYRQTKHIKKLKKYTGKKWLIDATILQLGGLTQILNIGIYTSIFFDLDKTVLSVPAFIISSFIILFALVLYVSIFVVSPKLKNEMAKHYPEYKFA